MRSPLVVGALAGIGLLGAVAVAVPAMATTPTTGHAAHTTVSHPSGKTSTHTATKAKPKTETVQITAPAKVTPGSKLTIDGLVTTADKPLAGRLVTLQERGAAKKWVFVAHHRSKSATGTVQFTLTQKASSEQYRLVVNAGGGYTAAASSTATVMVG